MDLMRKRIDPDNMEIIYDRPFTKESFEQDFEIRDGNWYVEVDGKAAEAVTVGEAMMAVMLTEGSHEVRFYYHNDAFALGWKISFACAAVLALLVWRNKCNGGKKGKYQKNKKEKH